MTKATQIRDNSERIKGVRKIVRCFADNSHMATYSHQRKRDREEAYKFIDIQINDENTRQELRDYYETHAFKEEQSA